MVHSFSSPDLGADITAMVDWLRVDLRLCVEPIVGDDTWLRGLIAWYERHGFRSEPVIGKRYEFHLTQHGVAVLYRVDHSACPTGPPSAAGTKRGRRVGLMLAGSSKVARS
ncbi:hypothetical protein [Actinomadura opuntiae]|uniref:hypothetical protein n=1 Tax=Actinomadura sp. OS1-43 TaxID=604315 RepID=UPI00255B21FE|nr:hypothetical protein [Actinomadura sp. OS1-43]MDL4815029.1 hypothetical protein [Actinomadura sp. OS1-43]